MAARTLGWAVDDSYYVKIAEKGVAPDFTISVSPTSGSVARGGSKTATVTVSSVGGFTDTVGLTISGYPDGQPTFSPSSGKPGFTSTLTIPTTSSTLTGTYTLTIQGAGGGKLHTCTYTLTVT